MRNASKLEILALASARGEITSSDVVSELGISQTAAATLLARYWRQGLLHRRTDVFCNLKIYSLSARGRERLDWLKCEIF